MCSSQTEPISACCRSFCRHQGDVYEGWFQVTFIIHLFLVGISKSKNRFLRFVPKPAYKFKPDCIFSFVFQGTKEAEGQDYVTSWREEDLCSSLTEPISACFRSSQAPGRCVRRLVSSDIYNSSQFSLHFYIKEWKLFF